MSTDKKTGLAIPEPTFIQKLETMDDMLKFGKTFITSGFAPKHFENPESVMVAIMYGTSIGLKVATSLQQVVVVNGLPTLKGDAAKALILSSGICTEWRESSTGTLDAGDLVYTITAKRSDGQEMTSSFSVFQAKRAGLWISEDDVKKDYKKSYGPWYKYPDRMIRYRALGFLARDLFPDVLQGMVTEEEAKDYVPFEDVRVITQSVAENVEDAGLKGGEMHISDQGGKKGANHIGEATRKLTKVAKLPELKKMTTATKLEKCASADEIYSNLTKDEMANLMMDLNIPFTTQTKADEMAIALWNYKCDQEAMNGVSQEEKVVTQVTPTQLVKDQVVLVSQVTQEEVAPVAEKEVVETPAEIPQGAKPPRPVPKGEAQPTHQPEPTPVVTEGKSLVKAEIKALVDKLPASVNSSREMNDIQGVWELVSGNWEEADQIQAIGEAGLSGDLEEVLNICTSEQINSFVDKL